MSNFVKLALENGGSIHPLIIPSSDLKGPAVTNPSIYNDDGRILVNLRNINYTLYHSEKKKYEHHWGPLVYIHPENDLRLRTKNIMCEMDDTMGMKWHHHIDTSQFPDQELWEFVGLEDARIVRWDGKLYICGVRRDTTYNGQGRMELSEIKVTPTEVVEVSRVRIKTPNDPDAYCEKNWMPILDKPYHYIKWSNPTEIVKVNPTNGSSVTVAEGKYVELPRDIRGGSQVVSLEDGYLALTHEVWLFDSETSRKDAMYYHRFIKWDKDWNIASYSDDFHFLDAQVEFSVGMVEHEGSFLITFGFQDNGAFILRAPKDTVLNFLTNNA